MFTRSVHILKGSRGAAMSFHPRPVHDPSLPARLTVRFSFATFGLQHATATATATIVIRFATSRATLGWC